MKKTLILAISGGVDSVVLLDIMSKSQNHRLIVAHVDHGIRQDSAADARFVAALARRYGVPQVSVRYELGEHASEERARDARYAFLEQQAQKYNASIMTAHHQDDVLGSLAINVVRGTGWRGICVLARADCQRPLLGWAKQRIYQYALENRLEWVEDATNASARYLRNRLRKPLLRATDRQRTEIIEVRARQLQLRHAIDREVSRVIHKWGSSRYHYTMIDELVAIELLRAWVWQCVGVSPSRPTAARILLDIKTARSGATGHYAEGLVFEYQVRDFIVRRQKK